MEVKREERRYYTLRDKQRHHQQYCCVPSPDPPQIKCPLPTQFCAVCTTPRRRLHTTSKTSAHDSPDTPIYFPLAPTPDTVLCEGGPSCCTSVHLQQQAYLRRPLLLHSVPSSSESMLQILPCRPAVIQQDTKEDIILTVLAPR